MSGCVGAGVWVGGWVGMHTDVRPTRMVPFDKVVPPPPTAYARGCDMPTHLINYRARTKSRASSAAHPPQHIIRLEGYGKHAHSHITTFRSFRLALIPLRHTKKAPASAPELLNTPISLFNSTATMYVDHMTHPSTHPPTHPSKHQTSLTLPNRPALEQTTSPFPSPTARPGSRKCPSAALAARTAPPQLAPLRRHHPRRRR